MGCYRDVESPEELNTGDLVRHKDDPTSRVYVVTGRCGTEGYVIAAHTAGVIRPADWEVFIREDGKI